MNLRVILPALALLTFTASAQAVTYSETFVLTGAQVVPPVSTTGFGAANVSVGVDTATHTLTYNIIYTGLSSPVTSAGFFNAAAGSNGAAVVDIGAISGLTSNPLAGSATISNAEVQELVNGQLYLNIGTEQNPSGELRGQLPSLASPPATVPEPAALSLLGMATAALGFKLARRR